MYLNNAKNRISGKQKYTGTKKMHQSTYRQIGSNSLYATAGPSKEPPWWWYYLVRSDTKHVVLQKLPPWDSQRQQIAWHWKKHTLPGCIKGTNNNMLKKNSLEQIAVQKYSESWVVIQNTDCVLKKITKQRNLRWPLVITILIALHTWFCSWSTHSREQTAGTWRCLSRENIYNATIVEVPWWFRFHGYTHKYPIYANYIGIRHTYMYI